MQQIYDKNISILNLKYIPSNRTGYSLNSGIYEIIDINKTLEYILPNIEKVSNSIDEIRIKSNLNNNQTLIFTKKSFFYTSSGFTESHSKPLGDIEVLIQLIPGLLKSNKHSHNARFDKIQSKCNSNNGSIVNGTREPISYSFALDKPLDHKIYKEPRNKLLK